MGWQRVTPLLAQNFVAVDGWSSCPSRTRSSGPIIASLWERHDVP